MINRDRTGRQATEVMKYVTVLDFETGRVHMYTIGKTSGTLMRVIRRVFKPYWSQLS